MRSHSSNLSLGWCIYNKTLFCGFNGSDVTEVFLFKYTLTLLYSELQISMALVNESVLSVGNQ